MSVNKSNVSSLTKLKRSPQEKKRIMWAYLFLLPQIIFFVVFTIYPIIMSYIYSAYEWTGLGPLEDFIGLGNYIEVFKDGMFWNAFKNTFIYMFGVTAILMPTSLLLAYILNNILKKSSVFYRTLYFLPVVTTTAIIGIIVRQVLGNDGFVNNFLSFTGLIEQPISWFGTPAIAMFVVIIVGSWKFMGMMMVYWLAGLQTLPEELLEAAKIDGANSWNLFRYIAIPLLLPVATVILLLSVTSTLHVFDLVKTLTDGGPYFGTDVMDLFIYRKAFDPREGMAQMGFASAAGVIFGIATFTIVIILGWIINKTRL